MNETIDLTYNEISDNHDGKELFGVSTQTVKKAISRLEKKYFQERNIFRRAGAKSDYLFRYEIKNLLLLLVRLELDNPFSDQKAKKNGISAEAIKKIVKTYQYITEEDVLRDYEENVLMQSFNAEESVNFIETADAFKVSMTNFVSLFVKYYDSFSTDFFKKVIYIINTMSRSLVYYVHSHKKQKDLESFKEYEEPYDAEPIPRTIPLSLDLKNAVVTAINRIADEIYSFDENGVCSRKAELPEKVDAEVFAEICRRHMFDNLGKSAKKREMTAKEIKEDYKVDIDSVRQELDDFMSAYWQYVYPLEGRPTYGRKSKIELDKFTKSMTEQLTYYLCLHCAIKAAFCRKLKSDDWIVDLFKNKSPYEVFEMYEEARHSFSMLEFSDHSFGPDLRNVEKKAWDYAVNNGMNFMVAQGLAEDCVAQFRKKVDKCRDWAHEEFNFIEKRNFEGTSLEGIADNLSLLDEQWINQMQNMLAMILKLEADRAKSSGDKNTES